MELIFVTGVSGAGKSRAMDVLEDLDFYCVDNMPPQLVPTFLELLKNNEEKYDKVAIAIDIRVGEFFQDFTDTLPKLSDSGIDYKIVYLDCSNEILLKRYKLSRRRHPLMGDDDNNIEQAIIKEKKELITIRGLADFVIDTTYLEPVQLKERVLSILSIGKNDAMHIYCTSFGFKYGSPSEADLIFDVRCLPNPFYIPELKMLTGIDEEVSKYVMGFDDAIILRDKIIDLIDFLIPLYEKEGKNQLVIAMGCSGGRHRSVAFAEALYKHLSGLGYRVNVSHRDIMK